MKTSRCYDVVIIGGGPAGSAAGTILAQKNHRIAILEREKFPRYVIGESLLPFCYFPLERLNLIDKIKSSNFIQKHSVQFVRQDGTRSIPFYFSDHLDHEAATTWQVERNEFDAMLLTNAISSGVEVFEETAATSLIKNENSRVCGVRVKSPGNEPEEITANLVIDASGQSAFSASRLGWRIRDPKLKKIAIWSYFKQAARDPGRDEGATTIAYVDAKNWFWYIPLQNDTVSVGVVGDKEYLYSCSRDLEEIFKGESKKNNWIREHLEPARRQGPFRVTGDVSYRSRHCSTAGLILTGDAFAFLDPVFSSGLLFALSGGVLAGDSAHRVLKGEADERLINIEYSTTIRQMIETMRKLIYAFYTPEFSFGRIIKKYPNLKGDLTDCLIGNLNRDFSALFTAISELVPLPEPLDYGLPE